MWKRANAIDRIPKIGKIVWVDQIELTSRKIEADIFSICERGEGSARTVQHAVHIAEIVLPPLPACLVIHPGLVSRGKMQSIELVTLNLIGGADRIINARIISPLRLDCVCGAALDLVTDAAHDHAVAFWRL